MSSIIAPLSETTLKGECVPREAFSSTHDHLVANEGHETISPPGRTHEAFVTAIRQNGRWWVYKVFQDPLRALEERNAWKNLPPSLKAYTVKRHEDALYSVSIPDGPTMLAMRMSLLQADSNSEEAKTAQSLQDFTTLIFDRSEENHPKVELTRTQLESLCGQARRLISLVHQNHFGSYRPDIIHLVIPKEGVTPAASIRLIDFSKPMSLEGAIAFFASLFIEKLPEDYKDTALLIEEMRLYDQLQKIVSESKELRVLEEKTYGLIFANIFYLQLVSTIKKICTKEVSEHFTKEAFRVPCFQLNT